MKNEKILWAQDGIRLGYSGDPKRCPNCGGIKFQVDIKNAPGSVREIFKIAIAQSVFKGAIVLHCANCDSYSLVSQLLLYGPTET